MWRRLRPATGALPEPVSEPGWTASPHTDLVCNRLLLPTAHHLATTSQSPKVPGNCWLPVAGMFPKVPNNGLDKTRLIRFHIAAHPCVATAVPPRMVFTP